MSGESQEERASTSEPAVPSFGTSEPAPPLPPLPPGPPAGDGPPPGLAARLRAWWKRRNDRTQARWQAALHAGERGVRRTALLVRVVLVQVRYTLSYMATGFLVSGPIQIGLQHEGDGAFYKSIILGLLFLAPALLLVPLTRVDWHLMRLPEFKVLEKMLARWTALVALVFLGVSAGVRAVYGDASGVGWLFDPHVARVNLSLMVFALVRAEVDAWLFPEFYALSHEGSLVLLQSKPPRPVEVRAAAPGTAGTVPGPAEPPAVPAFGPRPPEPPGP